MSRFTYQARAWLARSSVSIGLILSPVVAQQLRSPSQEFRSELSLGLSGQATSDVTDDGGLLSLRFRDVLDPEGEDEGLLLWGFEVELWELGGRAGSDDTSIGSWRLSAGGGQDWRQGERLLDWRFTYDWGILYQRANLPPDGSPGAGPRLDSFGVCFGLDPEVRLAASEDLAFTAFAGVEVGASLVNGLTEDGNNPGMTNVNFQVGLRAYADSWFGEVVYVHRDFSYGDINYGSLNTLTVPGPDASVSAFMLSVGVFL